MKEAPSPQELRFRPLVFRGVLVALLAGAIFVPLALVALPYIEFFNGMAVQQKGKPQEEYGWGYAVLAPTYRPPASGTLPHGVTLYPVLGPKTRFEPNDPNTGIQAGRRLRNPLGLTRENLVAGARWFKIYCNVCHGPYGEGNGAAAQRGFPAPPSLQSQPVKDYPDGRLFHIISKGQRLMPAYDKQIPPEERWKIVYFIHALHEAVIEEKTNIKD